MIENKARNDGRISEPSDVNTGTNNLTSIKLAYKHKRMQSKHALVSHYKSLSLMNTDDFSKFMTYGQEKYQLKQFGDNYYQKELDDISSIYTTHGIDNNLEATIKRVRDRGVMLDNLEEKEDIRALNSQIKHIEIEESDRENDESKILGE